MVKHSELASAHPTGYGATCIFAHLAKEIACSYPKEPIPVETDTKNGGRQRLSHHGRERSLCCNELCVSPFVHLLKGEHAMKDEALFSHDGPPPTTSDHERGDGDRCVLLPAHLVPQEALASAHPS
jgi:hypothetical protein